MLRALKKWFGGKYSRTLVSGRAAQPRWVRLEVEALESRVLLTTHVFLVNGLGDPGTGDNFSQLAIDLQSGPMAALNLAVNPAGNLNVNVVDWDNAFGLNLQNNIYSNGDGSVSSGLFPSDATFVSQMASIIDSYPASDNVILIGHSYGGNSVLDVANAVYPRPIELLATLDPVGPGGFRSKEARIAGTASVVGGILLGGGGLDPIGDIVGGILGGIGGLVLGNSPVTGILSADNLATVPANVQYFYNRFQEQGIPPVDYRTSGYILSHATASISGVFEIPDQALVTGGNFLFGSTTSAHLEVANSWERRNELLDMIWTIDTGSRGILDATDRLFIDSNNTLWMSVSDSWSIVQTNVGAIDYAEGWEGGYAPTEGEGVYDLQTDGHLLVIPPGANTGQLLDANVLSFEVSSDGSLGLNLDPVTIQLSNSNILNSSPIDTVVGTLLTIEGGSDDTFTYSLVSGAGATDNASFTIVGNQLLSAGAVDFAAKSTYSIRVSTTFETGQSYEQVLTITVLLPAPTPIAPTAGATLTTATPTFQWSAVPEASYYNLVIIDAASETVIVAQAAPMVTGTSFSLTTPLEIGYAYEWYVQAIGASGSEILPGLTSYPVYFHVALVGAPTLGAPANGATVTTFTPTLQWTAVPGATNYTVTLIDTTLSTTPLAYYQVAGTSLTISPDLVNGDTYQWYVQAFDNLVGDSSGTTNPSSFTVSASGGGILGTPTLIAPAAGASLVSSTPKFQWSTVAGAAGYNLYIEYASLPGPTITMTGQLTGTSYTPTIPLPSNVVQWWVTAYNSAGNISATPAPSSFTVGLPAPSTVGPSGTVTTYTPTFQWSPVAGAGAYSFIIDDTTANIVFPTFSVSGTSYTPVVPLADGHNYFWSVAAYGSSGLGNYANVPFTVSVPGGGTGSLGTPTLGPPSGVTDSGAQFSWSTVAGAVGYGLYIVDTNGAGQNLSGIAPIQVDNDSSQPYQYYQLTGETLGHTYIWWVVAYDSSGDVSQRSQPLNFYVTQPFVGFGEPPPPIPALSGPLGTVNTLVPTFTWSAVAGTSIYDVTIIDQNATQAVVGNVPISGTSWAPPFQFNNGDTYDWYVSSSPGEAAEGTFTIAAPPLGSPTPLSPAAGSSVTTTTPTFHWSAVPGATGYLLGAAPLIYGPYVSGTSYTFTSPLLNGVTYQWSVAAVFSINGASVVGSESATLQFTVSVPGTPILSGPSGTVDTHTPTMQWSAISGAAGYTLTLQDTTTNTTIINQQVVSGTSYTPSTLLVNGDSYQWYVQAYDNVGDIGIASQAFTFTVGVTVATPVLDEPTGSVTTTIPPFQWSAVSGAAGYTLYVTDTTTNTPIYNGLPVSGTSYTPETPLADGDSFQWWVTAFNSTGDTSPAPQPLQFTVAPTIGIATAIAPAGITTATEPTLQWSAAAGAALYSLTLIDSTTGVDTIPLVSVNTASYTLGIPLTVGDTYQWYVQAFDSTQQQSTQSNTAQFTVVPNSITGVSPGGQVLIGGRSTTITWTNSNFTGNVDLLLSTDGGASFGTTIATNQTNTGSYDWTVLSSVNTSQAEIRVQASAGGSPQGTSNAFALIQPGVIATVPNTSGLLNRSGVAVDNQGDLFFADTYNNVIREFNVTTGIITIVAGNSTQGYSGDNGPATSAELDAPYGVTADSEGDLFFADTGNNVIREVNATTGIITTVAGNGTQGYSGDNGPATSAELDAPLGVAVDSQGDLFFADTSSNVICEVNATTHVITTVAGNGTQGYSGDNGPATSAELDAPLGIGVDSQGDLFFSDYGNDVIREVNATTHSITTVAGNGTQGYSGDNGPAASAELSLTYGVAVDSQGDLFFADTGNNVIREVNATTHIITTVAGDVSSGYTYSGDNGPATSAGLSDPDAVAVDSQGDLFITDSSNDVIREVATLPPSDLSYGTNPAVYTKGTAIPADTPTSSGGAVASYGISPALPAGLNFNTSTGAITGTPTALSAATTYTVTATNSGGSTSTNLSIAVNATPAIPTMTGPSSLTTTALPTFTWSNTNADHYALWVEDDTTAVSPFIYQQDLPGTSASYTTTVPLVSGHQYTAWVEAFNSTGQAINWSQSLTFTVQLPTPPAMPTLTAPSGNITTSTPTITWTAPSTGTPAGYDLWLSYATTPDSPLIRQPNLPASTTSFTTSTLPLGYQYEVWVRAFDNSGQFSQWSATETFTTVNPTPAIPTMTGPSSLTTTALPTFTWTNTNADHYALWVEDDTTSANPFIYQQNLPGTSASYTTTLPLVSGHQYTAWVEAFNSTDQAINWSQSLIFTVQLPTPPAMPTLTAPSGNITTTTPTITWTAPSTGTPAGYDLWLSYATTPDSPLIRQANLPASTTSFTTSTLPLGYQYEVWVRAFDNSGQFSQWSATETFFIMLAV